MLSNRWHSRVMMFVIAVGSFVLSTRVTPAQQGGVTQQDLFSRYTTPGQCEQAARRVSVRYWRDRKPDTVVYAPETDSMPPSVAQVARACASRFDIATVPIRELPNLIRVYLLAQQGDSVPIVARRLLDMTKDPEQRGALLAGLIGDLLDARPVRRDFIQQFLQQLDGLRPAAPLPRMAAHTQVAQYAMAINDRAFAIAEARAATAVGSTLGADSKRRHSESIVSAYAALAEPLAIERGGVVALALFDSIRGGDVVPRAGMARAQRSSPNGNDLMAGYRSRYELLGTAAAPVQAQQWYNISNTKDSRPRVGTVSLLVFVDPRCEGGCYATYATIRRLHARYADRLDIILLATTHGYYRNKLTSPPEEADSVAAYYTTFVGLPVGIAVEATPYAMRHMDGMRLDDRTENQKHYSIGVSGVLIDKHGKIRFAADVTPKRERVWNDSIHKALAEP